MLGTSCKPIILAMVFDLSDLLLISGVSGTSTGIPYTFWAPLSGRVFSFLGMFLNSWAGTPGVSFVATIWMISIYTRISYPLGIDHCGGGECKGFFLGGL